MLEAHLAVAGTGAAGLGTGSRFGAGAIAGLARLMTWYLNFGFESKSGLFKVDRQVVAQVISTSAAAATTPASTTAEDITEDIAEDVFKRGPTEASGGKASALLVNSGMAVLIVKGALLSIRENRIGFGKFLEAFFCIFITGIFVGMTF